MDTSDHGTAHSNLSSPPRPPLAQSTQIPSYATASSSFTSSVQHQAPVQYPHHGTPRPAVGVGPSSLMPQTPPASSNHPQFPLSPPSPPGRRFAGGLGQQQQVPPQPQTNQQVVVQRVPLHEHQQQQQIIDTPGNQYQQALPPASTTTPVGSTAGGNIPPPPDPPGRYRPPNPFNPPKAHNSGTDQDHPHPSSKPESGRYVPHVVTISLNTSPILETTTTEVAVDDLGDGSAGTIAITTTSLVGVPGRGIHATGHNNGGSATNATRPQSSKLRPRLGQLLEACPLDGAKASAVTCVKFSPSTDFCLIGYGVRETLVEPNGNQYHPVTALYRVRGGMAHVSTMLSGDDDVNIARFHPDSGYGFVYGTKQGRVRVLSPRPWNYYNC